MSDPAFARVRSDLPGIEWPPISEGQAAALIALVRQLDDSQWLPSAAIAAGQLAQLGALAEFCAEQSAHFRARLAAADLTAQDLATPGALARLPLLNRRDLQGDVDPFCDEVPERHLPLGETRTSGSTGEPVVVRRTAVSQLDWLAMAMRDHLWHKRDFSGRLASVRANTPALAPGPTWGPPTDMLFDTGPSLGIPITTGVEELVRLLRDFRPTNLAIYPGSLAALVARVEADGAGIEGLSQIRTIGETLSPELRAAVRRVFAIEATDIYSSQEVGYIALQCPDGDGLYHVMAETVIVEVLDAAGSPVLPGEVGRVVITDLHNFATPLIRYAIGDYAEAGAPCPCGRGLPTLRRILGRERNLILMPDGTRHWPLVGFKRFRDIAPIRQYQLIQHAAEAIEARLVVDRALTAGEEAALGAHIASALGHPFAISFAYFDDRLPVPASGKFEEFVCRVTD